MGRGELFPGPNASVYFDHNVCRRRRGPRAGDSLNICIFLTTSHVVLHTQQTAAHTLVLKQGAHAQNVNSVLGGFIFVDWLFIFIHW